MGYIRPQSIKRYSFPSNPAYYFEWKSFVSYGDVKRATQASLGDEALTKDENGETKADQEVATRYMMAAYIADWNLDDDAGVKLPITAATLEQLEDVDFSALAELFSERMTAKATELKN